MKRITFDRKEIDNATEMPGALPTSPPVKTFDTPISAKENYRLVYERKVPFWIPLGSDRQLFAPRIDPDNIARIQVFEANPLKPEEMKGDHTNPDKFGVPWIYVPQVGGSMVEPGSPILKDANDWLDVIRFPDVASWDWVGSAEANKQFASTNKWFMFTFVTGFFERLISFMDFENAAVALIDDDQKEAVHSLFASLVECYCDIIGRAYNAYPFDAIWFHDDWGAQRSPFFSLDVAMEMIVPYIKQVREFCHSIGVFFDMHSCGKNDLLVPAYIEIGADSWSGQPMNDKQMIYDQYGGKLILGVELDISWTAGNPPLELDTAEASAKRWLDKFIPSYLEKPVLMGGLAGAPAGYSDFVYEASRNAFNDLAGS
ncbi:MAG: methyltransferase [Coriobacteriia bacterium]|nr:methyltransferase [Coriobacteriia bacterium]